LVVLLAEAGLNTRSLSLAVQCHGDAALAIRHLAQACVTGWKHTSGGRMCLEDVQAISGRCQASACELWSPATHGRPLDSLQSKALLEHLLTLDLLPACSRVDLSERALNVVLQQGTAVGDVGIPDFLPRLLLGNAPVTRLPNHSTAGILLRTYLKHGLDVEGAKVACQILEEQIALARDTVTDEHATQFQRWVPFNEIFEVRARLDERQGGQAEESDRGVFAARLDYKLKVYQQFVRTQEQIDGQKLHRLQAQKSNEMKMKAMQQPPSQSDAEHRFPFGGPMGYRYD